MEFLQAQIALTLWLQSLTPALDPLVKAINFLQTEDFFIIALPIVWWCVNKRIGASLVIFFTSCEFLSRYLKSITGEIRPYDLDSRIRDLDHQPDSSFPSAGVADTVIFWGYLATQFRQRLFWIWFTLATVIAMIARIYLGTHYLTDVLASLIIGTTILVCVIRFRVVERIAANRRTTLWIMAIAWPLLLALVRLNPETAVSLGAMLGFNIGILIEGEHVRFDPRGEWWKHLLKFAIGLGIAMGLRFSIKAILPVGDAFIMLRYAIIGLWMGVGAPWFFVLARLAGRERASD
jgi:membrane-associated phospholipid phosphatase